MPNIKPNRTNYEDFCEEPELTREEHVEWKLMARAICTDDALQKALHKATRVEREALNDAFDEAGYTSDWSDMVEWADASHRLMRAELEWWRERRK